MGSKLLVLKSGNCVALENFCVDFEVIKIKLKMKLDSHCDAKGQCQPNFYKHSVIPSFSPTV